jgi:hypothetical protein
MCLVRSESLIFGTEADFRNSLRTLRRVLRLVAIANHFARVVFGINRGWIGAPQISRRLRQPEGVESKVVEDVAQSESVLQNNLLGERSHLDQILCRSGQTSRIVDDGRDAIAEHHASSWTNFPDSSWPRGSCWSTASDSEARRAECTPSRKVSACLLRCSRWARVRIAPRGARSRLC